MKITDFGLSRFTDQRGDMTAETGTYRWMAPEVNFNTTPYVNAEAYVFVVQVIRHEPYTGKADVYSFAMVLFEMLTRQQPFAALTPVQAAFAVARENLRPALPSGMPEALGNLIKCCWQKDPMSR